MTFPRAIAEAQRASLAGTVREAYDLLEPAVRGLEDAAPHLIALEPEAFAKVRTGLEAAEAFLFEARTLLERRPDS